VWGWGVSACVRACVRVSRSLLWCQRRPREGTAPSSAILSQRASAIHHPSAPPVRVRAPPPSPSSPAGSPRLRSGAASCATGRPAVLVLLARGVFLVGARYKMVAFTDVTVLACVQVEMGNKRNHKGQKARAARTLPRYDGRSRSRL
jgi:hypothetical protein